MTNSIVNSGYFSVHNWFIHILGDPIFINGKNCNRDCDGTPKICVFKFAVEAYDTMSA